MPARTADFGANVNQPSIPESPDFTLGRLKVPPPLRVRLGPSVRAIENGGGGRVHSVSVTVGAEEYLAGLRYEAGCLFIPTLSDARVGDQAAVRVGIYGQTIQATVFGRISVVRRVGRPALPPGVELRLDRASLSAAGFLAMAARGEPVNFRTRQLRYSVERRIGVVRREGSFETTTLNVSEGGCALRWPGQLALVGDLVTLRVSEGFFGATTKGVVCWNQPGGPQDRSVGLRVFAEGLRGWTWRGIVRAVAKEGARAA